MASSRVFSSRLSSRLSTLLRPSAACASPPLPPLDPPRLLIHLCRSSSPKFPSSPTALFLRHLSTASRRHPSSRPRTVDIGARARQLQNRRLLNYGLTFSCLAGFIVIVLSTFQDQLVFYITPTEAMEQFAANPTKNRFRLGGLVLEGSIVEPTSASPEMEFVITDLVTEILVRFEGSVPDLFREGHSAVVEGFLRPSDESDGPATRGPVVSEMARAQDCYFRAVEVLAKHDEKYMPKEVAEAIERNKKLIEAKSQAEAAETTS